jgi:hypothetical protein
MHTTPLEIAVSNNRTPIELVVPFSGDMAIEQLLDVVKTNLEISLDWTNFPDLGTSCGTSLSITVDRVPQSFKIKLSELTSEQRAKLQLWIKFIWRDKLDDKGKDDDVMLRSERNMYLRIVPKMPPVYLNQRPQTANERGKITLERMESIVQQSIWRSFTGRSHG